VELAPVQYAGGAGIIDTYQADGTVTSDYNAAEPMVATYRGNRWESVTRGTTTSHYTAKDGIYQFTVVSSSLSNRLTHNGSLNNSGPADFNLEPMQYTCDGDTMRYTSTQGNYSGESVRVRPPSPPPATSATAVGS
jgi:hypothetical protein